MRAFTGNMSSSGLFLKTQNPLTEGEQFLLKLQLPDIPEPMRISCEVVWSRKHLEASDKMPAGMGVKFVEMSKKDRDTFNLFLSRIPGMRLT
jgi:uncharacterized protein (TIGR02266 family)